MIGASPTPYLDPIVTRRRSGSESGSSRPPGSATISSGATNFAQRGVTKGPLETIAEKRSGVFPLSRSAGLPKIVAAERQCLQKRKAVSSADLSRTENPDLAYLVVNLQSDLLKDNSAGE